MAVEGKVCVEEGLHFPSYTPVSVVEGDAPSHGKVRKVTLFFVLVGAAGMLTYLTRAVSKGDAPEPSGKPGTGAIIEETEAQAPAPPCMEALVAGGVQFHGNYVTGVTEDLCEDHGFSAIYDDDECKAAIASDARYAFFTHMNNFVPVHENATPPGCWPLSLTCATDGQSCVNTKKDSHSKCSRTVPCACKLPHSTDDSSSQHGSSMSAS